MVLSYTNRTADVYPYDASYEPVKSVPIVTGATTYHHPNGKSYIIIINEALFYGNKLDHSLINPNQIRYNGVGFWDNPYDDIHELCIEVYEENITIPMQFNGTKLIFESTVPTEHELNVLPHLILTSSHPWDPGEVVLGQAQRKQPTAHIKQVHIHVDDSGFNTLDKYMYAPHVAADDIQLHEMNPVMRALCEFNVPTNEYSLYDIPQKNSFISHERHNKHSAETLAENWCIGLIKAKATLNATTQHFKRSAILPISRRYRADRFYDLKKLDGKFSTDTIWADVKSVNQHKYAQVYTHKCGFAVVYPINNMTGDSIGQTLIDFIHDFGVPQFLTFDGHKSQVGAGSLFMRTVRKHHIKFRVSEPRKPEQNPSEGGIREIKRRWYHLMMKKKVPKRLWDFGITWICETGNLAVSSSRYANGRTSIEIITGDTPDISEYIDFGFYDWVTYRSNAGLGELSIGRWLGVSHKVGQLMSYWILTKYGKVISCTTVQQLTELEQQTIEWQDRMRQYDESIETKIENVSNVALNTHEVPQWNRLVTDEYDADFINIYHDRISDNTIKDADILNAQDKYVHMEVGIPRGPDGDLENAVVKKRALDIDGIPIGTANKNPILDTRAYEVEYDDGTTEILSANIIAECILSQVDDEGHKQMLFEEIIDHRSTADAVKMNDIKAGSKGKLRTTKGWDLCVQWKGGQTTWVALKDMKNGFPVQTADYAMAKGINEQPAFAWWVPYVLRKSKRIISKMKSKYWQRTHKYGIKIPKNVREAYAIDRENGNELWSNAIKEEMIKIKGAMRIHNGDPEMLKGYQEITGHIIFDVKLGEGFRRKARFVGDGHKTETPNAVTYSSVVSRDSVRIILMIAALNDLDIEGADIENAYLTAPCREKVWLRGGIEFGDLEGEVLIVEKALYGLKSSGAAFRAFLAETFDRMGFTSSVADPDVWLRPAIKPDGEQYYEYIICYVDDVLGVSVDAQTLMKDIQKDFKFKKDKIEPPSMYLGARLEMKQLNGKRMWTMCSKDYVKLTVNNIENQLQKRRMKLPSKATTPMDHNYIPELDDTPELHDDDITFYQEIIGMLRWAIEIGRVDINTEISLLSSFQAAPREGHLNQLLRIVAFLKRKPKLTLYFDPSQAQLDENMFNSNDHNHFKDHYRDAVEELPDRRPKPRGRAVKMIAFVDASHAANRVTRKSHTGYVIFINRAPIIWYSKRQNTVESSTFTSEFIALKTCMERIVGLRFKLRMFGIPIDGTTDVLCDNQSVVNNSSKFESTLDKKHASIAYHAVRWSVAAGIIRVGKIHKDDNIADAFTKRLSANKREFLFGNWTY